MKHTSVFIPVLLTGLFLFAGLTSCNNGAKKKPGKQPERRVSDFGFQPGKIYDTVPCAGHPGETYALYLPRGVAAGKHFPVIFFFDAQARGILPVKRYRPLADTFGFILVASNNSKNGLTAQERNRLIYNFMSDVEKRFPLDTQRIYTGGFSGGARIAAGIGLSNPGIAGVIGCAAGFPQLHRVVNKQMAYVGVVGNTDFNYLEMETLSQELEAARWRHCLLVFDGHHQWPPRATMKEAFSFLQTDAMRRHLIPVDTRLVQAIQRAFDQKRKDARKSKNLLLLWQTDRQAIAFLEGLSDVSPYQNELQELLHDPLWQKLKKMQTARRKEEREQQQRFARALPAETTAWWQKALHDLASAKTSAVTPAKKQRVQRLYNYLSLMAYLYADGSLKNGQTEEARKYLMIYRFVDPDNPEVYYLKARWYAETGQRSKVLSVLQKAADKGFYDFKRLGSDADFSSFHQNKTFLKILAQVKNNPMKEM